MLIQIRMVGIDHRKAALGYREAFSFTKAGTKEAVRKIKEKFGVKGCVLISTCNRTELWVSKCGQLNNRNHVDNTPYEMLCQIKGIDRNLYQEYFVARENQEAIDHLLKLTCGFDSKIFGEDQIISQIREALQLSRENDCADMVLEKVFQTALSAGKKVKSEVQISRVSRTSANDMVTILKEKLGKIRGVKCLVIGNGQMGKLVANTLIAHGAEVAMTLRRQIHGRDEQDSIMPEGCRMVPYDNRIHEVPENKVVVSATLSPHYTLKKEDLLGKLEDKCYMFDLAVPRDIDPEIGKLNGVELYDIDTINGGCTEDENIEQIEMARIILGEYRQELNKWFEFRKHVPKIQGIVELVSEDTIERFASGTEKLETSCPITDINDIVEESVKKSISKLIYGLKETLPPEIWAECVDGLHKAAAKETLKH